MHSRVAAAVMALFLSIASAAVAAPPAPTLTNGTPAQGDASGASPESAETLHGTVSSNGCNVVGTQDGTYVRFEAVKESEFNSASPVYNLHTDFVNVGSVTNAPVAGTLTGLEGGITYHWRMHAINECDSAQYSQPVNSPDSTFTTGTTPPPSYVGPSVATLAPQPSNADPARQGNFFGQINPHNCPGQFSFSWRVAGASRYSPTEFIGTDLAGNPFADDTVHDVGVHLDGLTPNTTYEVGMVGLTVCADNQPRFGYGDVRSFTTHPLTAAQLTAGLQQSAAANRSAASTLVSSLGTRTPTVTLQAEEPGAAGVALAALITQDGGSLITQDGGSLITQDGGSLITQDGGSLITQDGGSLITQDGGSRSLHATIARKHRKKRLVVLAFVARHFDAPGTATAKLTLTKAGRRVMKKLRRKVRAAKRHHGRAPKLSFGLHQLFAPTGQPDITDVKVKVKRK